MFPIGVKLMEADLTGPLTGADELLAEQPDSNTRKQNVNRGSLFMWSPFADARRSKQGE
jgi:hypothetical protein